MSNEQEKEKFAFEVLAFINPKYSEESDFEIDKMKLIKFAGGCDLTRNEFLMALELSSKKQLFVNDKIVEYYREIDFSQLGAIESGYLEYKRKNKKYEMGKERLNEYLNPPKELTPEEKERVKIEWLTEEYQKLQKDGFVHGSILFYELLKPEIEKVNLSFVERTLGKFRYEIPDGKTASGMSIIKKNDVKTFFINQFVFAYIKKNELKELSLEDWINHWVLKKTQNDENESTNNNAG